MASRRHNACPGMARKMPVAQKKCPPKAPSKEITSKENKKMEMVSKIPVLVDRKNVKADMESNAVRALNFEGNRNRYNY